MATRHIGRANVAKRLARIEGAPGRTVYAGGTCTIESEFEHLRLRPPFGLAHEGEYDRVRAGPLLEELERDHVVGVLLVRLGGYAVGILAVSYTHLRAHET